MSSHPQTILATLSDLDALPEDIIGEIIDGVLYTRNRPIPAHQYAAAGIVSDLVPAFARGHGAGGWWILPDPALAQPGSPHFSPALAGWHRERIPSMPAGVIPVVPDWVCEILSSTMRRYDHLVKMPFYARIGGCVRMARRRGITPRARAPA
jgi:Uma2 family endonuclease